MSQLNTVVPQASADIPLPAVVNTQAIDATQQAAAVPGKKRHQWTAEKADLVRRLLENSQNTVKQIAALTKMSVRSIQRYVATTRPEGEGQEQRPFVIKPRVRQPKNKTALHQHIRGVLRDQNTATLHDIVDDLPGSIRASRSTVCREIKNMGWTRKRVKNVPVERNSVSTRENRCDYALSMQPILDDNVIYLDETGFNLHMSPFYGYAPAGFAPTSTVLANRGKNVSVMAAIGTTGVVAFEVRQSSYNNVLMKDFLQTKLFPKMRRGQIIVVDNARFHHSENVKACAQEAGIEIKYLPPYSPFLNPIEEMFGVVKGRHRAKVPRPKTTEALTELITLCFQEMEHTNLRPYYAKARNYYPQCFQKAIIEY
jgi:transposase